MKLIDADALKKSLNFVYSCAYIESKSKEGIVSDIIEEIDDAPTVEERPQGECRTCIHRDPEDKRCDCGGLERQGCLFPVSDDYFCKFYEKGGAE